MKSTETVEEFIENERALNEEKIEAITHKDAALKRLDVSFNKHIELSEYKKNNLLAYWIKDFANYHDNEAKFDTSTLKTFKRGDIIKCNLGFNIGKELGGLHYCIVLDKNDNPYNGNLNVIPLSSAKENKTYNKSTCIDLGDELYTSLVVKANKEFSIIRKRLSSLDKVHEMNQIEEMKAISQKLEYLDKFQNELSKMKHGSFALVHQITTISKQRIFRTSMLSGIKLSSEGLDLIDKKIIEMFTK